MHRIKTTELLITDDQTHLIRVTGTKRVRGLMFFQQHDYLTWRNCVQSSNLTASISVGEISGEPMALVILDWINQKIKRSPKGAALQIAISARVST